MMGLLRVLLPRLPASERRLLRLDGHEIEYELRRSARRTLGLKVDAAGLRVTVPLATSSAQAEAFVAQHRDWIARRLVERDAELARAPFMATDGAGFPLLGGQARLRIEPFRRRAAWTRDEHGEILLLGPDDPAAAMVRALGRRALPHFAARVAEHCARLGRAVPPVRITSAHTRWGSCSARSGIRLHWRLVHLAPELIDYVVAHEVAHLVEMNHSARFWTIVGRLHPAWQASRRALRAAARSLPVLQPGGVLAPRHED